MKNKFFAIFCLVITCATLITCALIVVKPNVLFRKPSGIAVKGVAMQRVQSDVATWAISVSSSVKFTDENAQMRGNALSNVSADAKKVVDFLLQSGFADDEIKTSNVSVYNMYTKNKNGYDTTEVCGKTAECTVSVQTKKFDALEKAVSNADKIGTINVNITAPSYLYSKLEDLKLDLIAKATANAKERAKTLACAGGSKLGKIMSASQGVFQITQPLSTETASYGMYDTSTVEKDVRCVVNVQFSVEN